MGKCDIQVVPIPHQQLQEWWGKLTEENQVYVRKKVGYLIELIHIKHQVSLIQALAQYWDVDTSTFIFAGHELAPTLEEYNTAIGVDFESRIVEPPVGVEPVSILAQFLALEMPKVEAILKRYMGRFPLSYLVDNYSDLPLSTGKVAARVFLLAFFGFVLFPCSKVAFDPVVAIIAKQACFKWDYSNMLLAETILSLNKYQREQRNITFKGSTGLLSMWFFAHLPIYRIHMRILQIDRFTNPLRRFFRIHELLPDDSFHGWANYILKLTPDQFQWRAPWPRFSEVRLTSTEGNMVPLLGFNGGTAYCPLRIVRQFGMIQEIPHPWTPEPFSFQLPHRSMTQDEKRFFQANIDRITRALKGSPRQPVVWPEEMEGEMKTYCATQEYIEYARRRLEEAQEALDPVLIPPVEEPPAPEYVVPDIPEVVSPPQEEDVRDEDEEDVRDEDEEDVRDEDEEDVRDEDEDRSLEAEAPAMIKRRRLG